MKRIKLYLVVILVAVLFVTLSGCFNQDTYYKKMTGFCETETAFTLQDVFTDIDFDKVLLLERIFIYSDADLVCQEFGLDTAVSFEPLNSDNQKRLFLIKDNVIVYDYSFLERELKRLDFPTFGRPIKASLSLFSSSSICTLGRESSSFLRS